MATVVFTEVSAKQYVDWSSSMASPLIVLFDILSLTSTTNVLENTRTLSTGATGCVLEAMTDVGVVAGTGASGVSESAEGTGSAGALTSLRWNSVKCVRLHTAHLGGG